MNALVSVARTSLLCVALAMGASALAAEPTLNEVYDAVRAGHLDQAQRMMSEVLRDHPNSAKAHYVEAEILVKGGHYGEARGELSRAEQLAPGLPFASATSVQELRDLIATDGRRQAPSVTGGLPAIAPAAHQASFPWGLVLIVLAGGLIIYAIVRTRRNAAVTPYGGSAAASSSGGAAAPGAPSASVAPTPMAPMGGGGIGSGIVGGLVTGAALGAGLVAGEALAHEVMGGRGSDRELPRSDQPAPPANDDLGGQDFGVNDGGSWDDGGGGGGGDGGGDWN